MMSYLVLAFDALLFYYFVNAIAHEAGWWSSGFLSWANPYDNFGRNNVWMLLLDSVFVLLWAWIFIDNLKEVI